MCYIDFKFESNFFQVKSNFGDFVLEKKYGSLLSDNEIDSIINKEVHAHKNFLNNTISEKENK
jgi:hypothetical protein